jgi:hypothetical protein
MQTTQNTPMMQTTPMMRPADGRAEAEQHLPKWLRDQQHTAAAAAVVAADLAPAQADTGDGSHDPEAAALAHLEERLAQVAAFRATLPDGSLQARLDRLKRCVMEEEQGGEGGDRRLRCKAGADSWPLCIVRIWKPRERARTAGSEPGGPQGTLFPAHGRPLPAAVFPLGEPRAGTASRR